MRPTEQIDDPNWDDITDRDIEILKLKVRLRKMEVRQTTVGLVAIEMRKWMGPFEDWDASLADAIRDYDEYCDRVRKENESK